MSSFGRIDHSEKQRRQVLGAIDLLREKDARAKLELVDIRAIWDYFSGNGQLQTRARHFFFVPWILEQHAIRKVTASVVLANFDRPVIS